MTLEKQLHPIVMAGFALSWMIDRSEARGPHFVDRRFHKFEFNRHDSCDPKESIREWESLALGKVAIERQP
jgi:hypothetical protein